MNFTMITCPLCGNNNSDMFTQVDGKTKCSYCNVSFVSQVFDDFNSKMDQYFDLQRQEKIANVKLNLWSSVHDTYKSNEKISTYARELKLLSPDDFLANFYDTACNGSSHDINTFLNNIKDFNNLKPFIEDIVDFMLSSFEESNVLPLKNLIINTFQNEEKTNYLTKLEDECAKLYDGMYASFIPRDVFVAYSSKDMAKVNQIVEYLESQDVSCYLALRNLRHGKGSVENYQNELKNAMNHCKCVVFISSSNSRSLGCDALKIELKYIQENLPNMKRIEYVIQDYDSSTTFAVKSFLKDFFKDLEHCRTLDDLSRRVFKIIMDYENPPTQTKSTPKPVVTEIPTKVNPEFKYCKKCGNKNPYTAKFCKSCRFDSFFDTLNEYESSKNMLYCEDCKSFNDSDARFCLNCGGTRLINLTQEPNRNQIISDILTPHSPINTLYSNQVPTDIRQKVEEGVNCYNRKEYKKALNLFNEGIKYNDGQAFLYIGLMHYYGLEFPKNLSTAVEWFTKGAEVNYPHAQSWLASCYKNGFGVPINMEKAIYWCTKASDQGHARAQNNLGYYYEMGQGVPKNLYKAVELYTKSAEKNDVFGINNLASCYYNGKGVSVDYKKAFDLYLRSAEQGNATAQCWVGYYYKNGKGGVPVNYNKAVEYYRKSADQNYARAQNNLGFCYEMGQGVPKDLNKAIDLYTKGANAGDMYAQYNLGLCYYNGKGVIANYYKAVELFDKAAAQGYADAQNSLGNCYYHGKG
ncbi:MAG: SEL1-like repeat protein, partial [Clostridia bacterium]|nr:SEL1-like repeat protein [Clostridia bacterium]